MEKKYYISFYFENWSLMKKIPRSKKSFVNCSTSEDWFGLFKNEFNEYSKQIGLENVYAHYTVYEDLGDTLGNFVYKIVIYKNKAIKYLDELQTKSVEIEWN